MAEKRNEIRPQEGPQTQFLSTLADIAIYGGAAGGGKSFALLLEPLRHINNPRFGGVIFRRTTKQIRNEGGLWDEALGLYAPVGAEMKETTLECTFPSGMKVGFAHLEYEKNIYDWQGAQVPFIGFDELTHFTETQFFYLLSRNRSTSDVPGYVRATTNPDSRSWVKRLIQWWIDEQTGLAIPERSGVVRWFIRREDKIVWADSRQELIDEYGPEVLPKSLTFISAKLEDNKIFMQKDPSYKANLDALPRVERLRLKDGNWNVESAAGIYFHRSWFQVVDALPADARSIRYWDRASTEVTDANASRDPDWTVGLKLLKDKHGIFYIADVARFRHSPLKVEQAVLNTARQDTVKTTVGIEQDPGSAGVADANNYMRLLAGFHVKTCKPTQDKITRALPVSAQCEAGNVKILRAKWNEDLFSELENFPDGAHDDQVDALSGAFNLFQTSNVAEFTPEMAKNRGHGTMAGKLNSGSTW